MNEHLFTLLEKRFENVSDADKAKQMSAYMRNLFSFYGIKTPERRLIYKDIIKEAKKSKIIDWQLLDKAWQSPKREMHYFVCDYLKGCQKLLIYEDIPHLLSFAKTNQWWDTIDHFDRILGRINDPRIKEFMIDLSHSDDFWLRRIAIDHQLGAKDKTDTELLALIICQNFGSQEFFINKAIGWSLRDYSKTNPEWVRNFIKEHKSQLAPLSIREASKYLN
ncbi:hypothetical protein HMPREF9318_02069 [Streptococcus urinalis FB127-CNA-2]|uniref:DNA alkylation repair enzyme n=1 Tax=Streptococcus urinalis 2285-97 TaxID=764291 RepID=G5KCG8_9STRE|nr:DNA alkylation repair protein [Streptococcus urinalis]EHJ57576.1 DNA alkylation repair enzyme [Streptococcus urinalis 2285-97]EKS17192.1 hypothetical protein HMPREF9318_02069 [Streptococcus urinalis FB127-CNA-2]VEF32558.1 DNA alkylation repair enzyme [Streptococcus urinalis]